MFDEISKTIKDSRTSIVTRGLRSLHCVDKWRGWSLSNERSWRGKQVVATLDPKICRELSFEAFEIQITSLSQIE